MQLYDLFHKILYLLRHLVLYLACSVGVSTQGESGVVVSQHGGNRFRVCSVLQGGAQPHINQPGSPEMRSIFGVKRSPVRTWIAAPKSAVLLMSMAFFVFHKRKERVQGSCIRLSFGGEILLGKPPVSHQHRSRLCSGCRSQWIQNTTAFAENDFTFHRPTQSGTGIGADFSIVSKGCQRILFG